MFYRLHCFHPPTDCHLCLSEFCLDTGWNYRLWSLEGILLEHVLVKQPAASSGHTQLFILTSEVQRSLLSSLPAVGACLKFLTCTAPAAARPGAPEGASSCGSLNCSCWWWQNRSCSTCRGHLERKKKKERYERRRWRQSSLFNWEMQLQKQHFDVSVLR